jgi:hypothetical protein
MVSEEIECQLLDSLISAEKGCVSDCILSITLPVQLLPKICMRACTDGQHDIISLYFLSAKNLFAIL